MTLADNIDAWVCTGAGDDTLRGSAGADQLGAGGGSNLVSGGDGADFLSVLNGNGVDSLYGGAGNDTIVGAGFDDIVDGGTGIDLLTVSLASFASAVNADDTLFTSNANWTRIEGYNVTLTDHNDLFRATTLRGRLNGGEGTDDVLILNRTGLSRIELHLSYRTEVAGFERLRFIGSDRDDTVVAHDGNDTLSGGAGNNTLFGGGGDDHLILAADGQTRAHGGIGNDRFDVLGGSQQVYGDAGNDVFDTVGTGHRIDGGRGFDRVDFDFAAATQGVTLTMQGTTGNWFRIEQVNGTLTSRSDTASLGSLSHGSVIDGGGGANTLNLNYSAAGRATGVTIQGGQISIRLADGTTATATYTNFETVQVVGTAGNDTMQAWASTTYLAGLGGDDSLTGTHARDVLDGGSGDDTLDVDFMSDTLHGGAGFDVLLGLEDNDQIFGGGDIIFGGLGADLFYVEGWADSGRDRIGDYVEGIDRIWIGGGLTRRDVSVTDAGADRLLT
ncbi:MAG: calcium-binding protein [Gemmobacter sp.]